MAVTDAEVNKVCLISSDHVFTTLHLLLTGHAMPGLGHSKRHEGNTQSSRTLEKVRDYSKKVRTTQIFQNTWKHTRLFKTILETTQKLLEHTKSSIS